MSVRLDIEEAIAQARRGRPDLQEIAARAALDRLRPSQDSLKARARTSCATLSFPWATGPNDSWPTACQEAKDHFRGVGDRINHAKFRQLEARHKLNLGDREEALFIDRKVAETFVGEGFRRGYFDQIANLVANLLEQEDDAFLDEAQRVCRDGVREATDETSLSLPGVLINCAELPMMGKGWEEADNASRDARLAKAADAYREAQRIAHERGDAMFEVAAMGNLAYVEHALGKTDEARRLYERALRISDRLGEHGREFKFSLIRHARLLSDLGHESDALALYDRGKQGLEPEELSFFLESMVEVLGGDPPGWKRIISGVS